MPVPSSSSSKPSKKEKKQKKETPKNIDSFKLPENSSNEVTKSNCPTKCNAVSNPPASQINNVVNRVPKNDSKSFKIEDLKLPPGITITKVDPCTVKSKVPMKVCTHILLLIYNIVMVILIFIHILFVYVCTIILMKYFN